MKAKLILLVVLGSAFAMLTVTGCRPDYPKCENDEHCKEKGEFCVNGLCQQCRGNQHCGSCQQCSAGKCTAVPGCCESDANCGAGQKCRNGFCGPQCVGQNECGAKEACQGGRCVPVACVGDGDCPAGQKCMNNDCISVEQGCSLQRVNFDFDEAVLTAAARAILDANANCLKQKGNPNLLIEGHCDERGTEEYNISLGDKRARKAKEYLQRLGVGGKIRTVSYGENRPLAQGSYEGAWSQNRRDEFVIE